jgi:hypothetical protein
MGITTPPEVRLSPGQRRFAEEHHAHLGMNPADAGVYLYREDRCATYRWLVDPTGQTLEADTFRKSPPEGIEHSAPSHKPRFVFREDR